MLKTYFNTHAYFSKLFAVSVLFIISIVGYSQDNSVAIGSPTVKDNAVLWLNGNGSQGLLLPSVSDVNNITAPDAGMIVYQSSDNRVYYRNASAWVEIGAGGGGGADQTLSYDTGTGVLTISGSNSTVDLSVNGDVTGTVGNTQLGNNTVDASNIADGSIIINDLISIGDASTLAGKVLVWGGTSWLTRDFPDGTVTGQVLKWNNTSGQWEAGTDNSGGTPTVDNTTIELQGGTTLAVRDAGITTAKLAPNAVTGSEIAAGAVGSTEVLDGSITNTDINTGANIAVSKLAPGTAGQVLTTVGGVPTWQPAGAATGDITDVNAGTGLTGGGTSGSVTLNVDAGTAANQIVQLDGSGRLPAVDGSQLTNLPTGTGDLISTNNLSDVNDPSISRTNLGLNSMATQDASAVAITGGNIDLSGGNLINAVINNSVSGDGSGLTGITVTTDASINGDGGGTPLSIADGSVTGGAAGIIADNTITNNDINSITTAVISDAGALATLGAVSGGIAGTITDGTITDADINNSAAINTQKLDFSGTSDGDILQISGGVPVWSAVGGSTDAQSLQGTAIDPALATPADGSVLKWVNANSRWEAQPDLQGSGATLPSLTDAQIVTSVGVDTPVGVSMSGAIVMDNTGTTSLQSDVVTTTEIGTAGLGDADKVLTTDGSGNPQWELKSSLDLDPINEIQNLQGVLAQGADANTVTITNLGAPVNPNDAATKAYVDANVGGGSQNLDDVLTQGNDAMGALITNLGDPSNPQDATTKNYVDAAVLAVNVNDADADPTNELQDLSGVLGQGADAGASAITNVADPTNPQDVATKAYVDANAGTDNQDLANVLGQGADANAISITNMANPTNPQDAATKAYVDTEVAGFTEIDGDITNEIQDLTSVLGQGADANATAITNLADPTNPQDAATKAYVDTEVAGFTEIDGDITNEIQDLTSVLGQGTDANATAITNLADPTNPQDAATKAYVDTEVAGFTEVDGDITNEIQDLTSVLGQGADANATAITNLADPTNPQDAATKAYVDTEVAGFTEIDGDITNEIQDLTSVLGQGADANATAITNLADPTNPQDAATKAYVDTEVAGFTEVDGDITNEIQDLTSVLGQGADANATAITNLADPTNPQDAATKSYVDNNALPAMTDAQIIISAGTTPGAQSINGDATIDNTGLLTNVGLQGENVSAVAPTTNQILRYIGGAWTPDAGGAQWFEGSTVPVGGFGNDGDFFLHDTTGDVYEKQAGAWVNVANIKGGDSYATTSTDNFNLSTMSVSDNVVLNVDAGLAYSVGQGVIVANTIANQFTADVTSYAGTTLNLVVTAVTGTANLSSWDVNLNGAPGPSGDPGASAYVYIGYADDNIGTGFTTTFDATKDFIAVLSTTTEIPAPAVGDFTGLWVKYNVDQLTDGTILVGDVGNSPQEVTMNGDVGIDNTGLTTIQPDAVTLDKIIDNGGTRAVLASGTTGNNVWLSPTGNNQVLGSDGVGNLVFRNVIDSGTGIGTPGSDSDLVSEAAVRSAIDAAGGVGDLQGAYDGGANVGMSPGVNLNIENSGGSDFFHLIESNNRLGIGTSTPLTTLHVAGGNVNIDLGRSYEIGDEVVLSRTGPEILVGSNFVTPLVFRSGDEKARITTAGNFGIGTSTPTSMLSVGATSEFQVNATGDLTSINNVPYAWPAANAGGVLTNDGAGGLTWSPSAGTDLQGAYQAGNVVDLNAGDFMRINDNTTNPIFYLDEATRNVGIGIAAPTSPLHILSSVGNITRAGSIFLDLNSANTDSKSYIRFAQETPVPINPVYFGVDFDNGFSEIWSDDTFFDFRIGTGNTERMIIDGTTGFIGIGTSTPTSLLTIGSGEEFQVDNTGNLVRINDVPYNWPAGNASGVLTNDGTGALSWAASAVTGATNGLTLNGSNVELGGTLTANTTIDLSSFQLSLTGNGQFLSGPNSITNSPGYGAAIGLNNTIDNSAVGIAIGSENNVTNHRAMALGNYVNANHLGSMVFGDWSGSSPALTASSTTDQFTSRFNGGYRFFTTSALDATGGIYFLNGGNVGIGTASAAQKLTVQQTSYGITHTDGSNVLSTFIGNTYPGAGSVLGASIGTQTDNPFFIYVNNNGEKFYIGNSVQNYNVGIGNSTPSSKLDVTGDINTSGSYNIGTSQFVSTNGSTSVKVGINAGHANTPTFSTFVGNGAGALATSVSNTFIGHEAGTNTTTGNQNVFLGLWAGQDNNIGTSNTFLGRSAGDNNTTGNENVFVGRDAGNTNLTGIRNTIIGRNADVGSSALTNATAIGYNASVTASNALVLGNGVDVGIGISAPLSTLHIHEPSTSINYLRITNNNTGSGSTDGHLFGTNGSSMLIWNYEASNMLFGTSGSTRVTIEDLGNVGIGFTNPSVRLDVNGSIEYTGTITDVSDERLKENLNPITSSIDKIKGLKGYSYNMKDDSTKTREYGVIAQDVQKVLPYSVKIIDPETGHLGVSYTQLIPVLIEATKEQQAVIENQETEIFELKKEIAALKASKSARSSSSNSDEELTMLKSEIAEIKAMLGLKASKDK